MSSLRAHLLPPQKPAPRSRRAKRAFTLIEVAVVLVIIGILSAMAMPGWGRLRIDNRIQADAMSVSDLIREARAHAIGRGAAVFVELSTDQSIGTFRFYESVGPNPNDNNKYNLPVSSCKNPSDWSTASLRRRLVRQVEFNTPDSYEHKNGIAGQILLADNSVATAVALCFTPTGRAYMKANPAAIVTFDSELPMTTSFSVEFKRTVSGQVLGTRRAVVVPSSGISRVRSY